MTYQARQADLKLREAETTVDITKAKLMTFGLTPEAVETLAPLAEGAKASLLAVKAPFAGTVVEKHAVLSERGGPQFQLFVIRGVPAVRPGSGSTGPVESRFAVFRSPRNP